MGGSRVPGREGLPAVTFELTLSEREITAALGAGDDSYTALARGAAVASGLSSPEGISRFQALADTAFQRMRPFITGATPTERAAQLLPALHRIVLRRPDIQEASPAAALERGTFNCVSATILFNLFARRLDLQTAAVAEPDHVYSLVEVGGRTVAVSTTIAEGYDRDLPVHESVGFVSSMVADRGKITDAALLALAVEDRIAFRTDDLLRLAPENDPEALGLLAALWLRIARLDSRNHDAASAYARILRKLGDSLDRAGRQEESFIVTRLALEVAQQTVTEDIPSAVNDLAVATSHAMESLIGQGRAQAALEILEQARATARCGRSTAYCQSIDSAAAELLHSAVRAQIAVSRDNAQVWPLAEGLVETAWGDREDATISGAALYESDRLARAGGPVCADEFLAGLHQKLLCTTQKRTACPTTALWGFVHLATSSPERAIWWFKLWLHEQ